MMLTSVVTAVALNAVADEIRLMRFPTISGERVVFTYASDLWLVEGQGGIARRLTSHVGMEQNASFSPDGKWIAFTGQYDGNNDVYVIPAEGGQPKRLTYEPTGEVVMGWTPDGKVAFASINGNHTNRMPRLWLVDPKGGMPIWTPVQEATQVSYSPDGKQMAFVRAASHQYNWRRYRGGTQGRISFWDWTTNAYSELPSGREQSYFPMWVGENVFFISDRNLGNINLYRYSTKSKKTDQLTQFKDGDMKWPSTDGKSIVFERNGRLHRYDIASGGVTTIEARVLGDDLTIRPSYRNFGGAIGGYAVSPSGKRLAAEARGDIFSLPARSGETRNLTASPGSREKQPAWTLDGQKIAYLSDASGEWQIMEQPQMGGEAKALRTPADHRITSFAYSPDGKLVSYTTTDYRLFVFDVAAGTSTQVYQDMSQNLTYDWAPDSNWIVYTQTQPSLFTATYLYNVKDKKSTKVTEGYYTDNGVAFDQAGKFLYIVSSRTYGTIFGAFEIGLHQDNVQRVYIVPLTKDQENPLNPPSDEEPVAGGSQPEGQGGREVRIDLDGLESRMLPLPFAPGSYPIIVGVPNGVLVWTNGNLVKYDVNARAVVPIISGISGFSLNPNFTKMAYSGQGVIGIADLRPGLEFGTGRVNTSDVVVKHDPVAEWRQMYWEVWRHQRDQFYDPKMLGLDWKAIGDKYAAMLPYAAHRSDISYIFGLMIGELGTGHAYVQGGEFGTLTNPIPPTGMLGADYEVVGRGVRFKKIYRGFNYSARGPLGDQGVNVKEGEYLVAIDGNEVTSATNLHEFLVNKVGKAVTLSVNSTPAMAGARKVVVRPIGSETTLRYESWVEENRAKVAKASGGRIGYIHVPDTSFQGIIGFVKGFYSQADKDAWVIDERYNGGGFLPTFFVEALQRDFVSVIAPRHGWNLPVPNALVGPKVMLINEHAGSGGDMLPYLFKRAKLGPLVGTRTWGGLVGIQGGIPLLDGGSVTSPSFGIYDSATGKWMAENTGVDPDIEIDDRPDLAAKGQDVQLTKAVEYLLNELKNVKPKFQGRPPFPTTGG